MEQQHKEYIDKSALVAEIARVKKEYYYDVHDEYDGFVRNALDDILSFLDTIDTVEVKEGNKKHLIDKSALMAEFEKAIDEPAPSHDQQCPWEDGYYSGLSKAESILDAIEVKEGNNLEDLFQALPEKIAYEKSHQVYELCIYHYDGQCIVDYVGEIEHDSLYNFSGNTLYEAVEKACNWFHENSIGE